MFVCCFNVLHEIGHSLCREYSSEYSNGEDDALNQVEEELLVNDFSVAFWKLHGENEFLQSIFKMQNNRKMKARELLIFDETNSYKPIACLDYKTYFKKYAYLTPIGRQLTFSSRAEDHSKDYANFQSYSIVESFEKSVGLSNVLNRIGIADFKPFVNEEKLTYKYGINTPQKVIADVRRIFINHRIDIPTIKYCIRKDGIYNCMKLDRLEN
jgi:hypothetical protein